MPQVAPDLPPRELIEEILRAGASAPNHHRTEPWRFVVLAGDERNSLGEVMADVLRPTLPDPHSEEGQRLLDKQRAKPLRAPIIIVAACVPSNAPKVVAMEELMAVAAAAENMLLAADALGLHAMWRTGPAAYAPEVKRFLDLPGEASIVAFLYIGYPLLPRVPRKVRPVDAYTTWRGWPQET